MAAERASSFKAFDDGIAEAERRKHGDFDGLIGQLPHDTSKLLNDILSDLRDCVLQKHSVDEARCLLIERVPRDGYHNVTAVEDDVEFALRLLISIHSATRSTDEDPKHPNYFTNLMFGKVGVREKNRRQGSSKGGVESVAVRRGTGSKREAILVAAKTYRGAPGSRTANIAKKSGATVQYVRQVLKEKGN